MPNKGVKASARNQKCRVDMAIITIAQIRIGQHVECGTP